MDYYDNYRYMHALMKQGHLIAKSVEFRMIPMPRRDYLHSLRKVKAAISVHSFGNVLIYPWGYKVKISSHKIYKIHTYGRVKVPKRMNFWKCFNQKKNIADFGPLYRALK